MLLNSWRNVHQNVLLYTRNWIVRTFDRGQPPDQVLLRFDVLIFGADFIFYMYHQLFIPEARKN